MMSAMPRGHSAPEQSGRPANLLGALAVGVHDAMSGVMVAATGLDATGVAALLVVHGHPGLSITQLADTLGLTHSGAVRSVDRLADRDLVVRGEGRDHRSRGLTPTAAGARLADDVLAARRSLLDELLHRLPEPDRARFVESLGTVLAGLPQTRLDAWRICRTCEHPVCTGADCPVGHAVP
jgi:DNA-binding MarR family transcriptional regulator